MVSRQMLRPVGTAQTSVVAGCPDHPDMSQRNHSMRSHGVGDAPAPVEGLLRMELPETAAPQSAKPEGPAR